MRTARTRLRPSILPILQTAAAAVIAWYLAVLLLPTDRPTFASIAAVICLGATFGRRPQRALELIGGVLLGIVVADLLLLVIDTGPLQLGLLVVLAMTAAVLIRGGDLFVNEAAISAILLVSLAPSDGSFSADRILEGVIGGGVALAVASLLFPPHPVALVGSAAQHLV
ncbi:MAG TPA: FUSC family protein, partial [Solirubrobacteraceae bacterium]|nr:FUSC family protein [Solirubrobacteraceae bacterium]